MITLKTARAFYEPARAGAPAFGCPFPSGAGGPDTRDAECVIHV